MALLDAFIVNVALPTIQSTLKANAGELELVIASYSLTYAIFLITGGRLGDIFGRKKLFILGMTVFTIASATCGLAFSPEILIVSRALQGFGAAIMYPQILSIIQVTFSGQKRVTALGVFAGVNGFATVIAQLLGGFLISLNLAGLSWRPIFLVNVPIGIAGVIVALIVLRESKTTPPPKLDLVGAGLIGLTLIAIVLPVVEGQSIGWPPWTIALLVMFLPLLVIFILYEKRKAEHGGFPLVNLKLFQQRSFSVGFPLSLLFFSTNGGLFYLIAIFLQIGLRYTALESGLAFTPIGVGFIIGSLSSPRIVKGLGRYTLSIGYFIAAVGLALIELAVRSYGTGIVGYELLLPFLVTGLGFGLGMAPLLGTVLAGVKREDVGIASGLLSTAIQIGIAVGVGVYGMIFYAIAGSSRAATLAASYLHAFELTVLIFFAVEITNFFLVFLLPRVSAGRVRDLFLERLPGPLPALALSFYFMSGGRVGRQIFDELIEGVTKRREEELKAPVDDFPAYVVRHFTETNEEDPRWFQFIEREALDSKGKFLTLREEREKLVRSYIEDIKNRQEKGFIDKSVDPENLALMVLALSFYPRAFAAVTKTITGLSPADPEFEKRWGEFLRDLAKRFEAGEHKES
jgi:EmrB/QacA subfamily drug resistance transporter